MKLNTSNGVKKYLALSISAGMLLIAGQALAAAVYEPDRPAGMMVVTGTAEATPTTQALPANFEKVRAMMEKLQAGTLTADEQKDLYGAMTQPQKMMTLKSTASGNVDYQVFKGAPGSMMSQGFANNYGYEGPRAWFGLMLVISVALVWVVLMLLIGVLWHHMRKHKHN